MSHNRVDVSMHAGDSRVLRVTITDDGTGFDITGATITWVLKRGPSAAAVLTKSTGGGVAIIDGPNRVFDVTLDEADTEDLAGLYYHEADVEESSGDHSTVVRGDFIVDGA